MIDDDRTHHDRTVPSFELEPPFTEARRPARPHQFTWGVLFDSLNSIASLMYSDVAAAHRMLVRRPDVLLLPSASAARAATSITDGGAQGMEQLVHRAPRTRLTRILGVLTGLILLLVILIVIVRYSDIWVHQFGEREPAHLLQAATVWPAPVPEALTVMNWNIKFGGGRIDFFFDCFGDRAVMTEAEVLRHLQGLADKINQVDPDILLLQEADMDSTRSAYLNQVQWLLDHTHLNHAAFASDWQVRWVPSNGLGRVNSGNAVLSRWPLTEAQRIALPLLENQSSLRRFFFLRRNVLAVRVDIPRSRPVYVLNTHLEPYGQDGTKQEQLNIFHRAVDRLADTGALVIAGGDLNVLPPGARHVKGFDDSACRDEYLADDYSAETAWLRPLFEKYASAIPLATYLADEKAYFSHTVKGSGWWNRTVDYLFSNSAWAGTGVVHQDEQTGMATMPLSDHAPLTGRLGLKQPAH